MDKDIKNLYYSIGYNQALKDINNPMCVIIKKWDSSQCPRCKTKFYKYEDCVDGYYIRATQLDRCPYCGQKLRWDI